MERFKGSRESRLEHFDRLNIRCDANDRNCLSKAADELTLRRADGFNKPITDETVIRRCCGRHRAQFFSNGLWFVVKVDPIGSAERPGGERRVA